ncbi:MAG: hypothetical protein AAFV27_04900 [Pseudomonadota bacterium]
MRMFFWLIPVVLSACSGGSVSNPLGSIGSGPARAAPTEAAEVTRAVQDGSVLVAGLESVVPEPALRGVILRVSAIGATQGYHSTRVRPVNGGVPDENGIATFEVRAFPPEFAQPVGSDTSRRILTAVFVGDDALEDVRGFRLVSAGNTVNLRR